MGRPSTSVESATLSRDLADFLIELSIGLHKNAIYPPGHPLLEHTSSELKRRLDSLIRDNPAREGNRGAGRPDEIADRRQRINRRDREAAREVQDHL